MTKPEGVRRLEALLDGGPIELTPLEEAAREFIVAEVGEDMGNGMSHQARDLVRALLPHFYRHAAARLGAEVPAKWAIQLFNEWAAEADLVRDLEAS